MILEGPGRLLRESQEHKYGGREWERKKEKREGGGCSRILMSTKGNISFSPPSSFCGYPMAHCSKSLSCKQGISHHALGFWLVSVSPCGTAWLAGCTCSAVLIEQMICQFVMFIFSAFSSAACPLPTTPSQHAADVSSIFYDRSCSHYWIIHACINVFR